MENVRRVIFKAPGMLIFRRCFLVKKVEYFQAGGEEFMVVVHGLRGRRETHIPIKGTIIRLLRRG